MIGAHLFVPALFGQLPKQVRTNGDEEVETHADLAGCRIFGRDVQCSFHGLKFDPTGFMLPLICTCAERPHLVHFEAIDHTLVS